MLKVDRVSEDLLRRYQVSEEAVKAMHEQRAVISDDEDDEADMKIDRVDVGITDADIKTEPQEEIELKME